MRNIYYGIYLFWLVCSIVFTSPFIFVLSSGFFLGGLLMEWCYNRDNKDSYPTMLHRLIVWLDLE